MQKFLTLWDMVLLVWNTFLNGKMFIIIHTTLTTMWFVYVLEIPQSKPRVEILKFKMADYMIVQSSTIYDLHKNICPFDLT